MIDDDTARKVYTWTQMPDKTTNKPRAYLKHAETGEWIEVPFIGTFNEDGTVTIIEAAPFSYTDVRLEYEAIPTEPLAE